MEDEITVRDITFKVCMLQFIETVKFLAEHNPYFKGQHNQISENIKDDIERLVNDVNGSEIATMGYCLRRCIDTPTEGTIEISVDPALASELSHMVTMEFKGKIEDC